MKRQRCWSWLLVFLLGLVACAEEATPTPLLPPPQTPEVGDVTAGPTITPIQPTATADTAAVESPTAPATQTALPPATDSPATPTPAAAGPTAAATGTATTVAITNTERLAPGQQAVVILAEGEFAAFPFAGAGLETLLFFVEPDGELDVDIAVYEAGVTAETDLRMLTPLAQASSGAADVPEVLVFVPDDDDDFSLVVSARGSGPAAVHFFDIRTQGTANTLAAGEVATGQYYSNISRPIVIFIDPVEDADMVIRATTPEGTVVAEANYGGPGSAEVLFLLPPQSAGFAFQISEATGAAGSYYLAVILLE